MTTPNYRLLKGAQTFRHFAYMQGGFIGTVTDKVFIPQDATQMWEERTVTNVELAGIETTKVRYRSDSTGIVIFLEDYELSEMDAQRAAAASVELFSERFYPEWKEWPVRVYTRSHAFNYVITK